MVAHHIARARALLKFRGLFGEREYFEVLITGLCEGVCGRAYRELNPATMQACLQSRAALEKAAHKTMKTMVFFRYMVNVWSPKVYKSKYSISVSSISNETRKVGAHLTTVNTALSLCLKVKITAKEIGRPRL
jgi:hypothetical protein